MKKHSRFLVCMISFLMVMMMFPASVIHAEGTSSIIFSENSDSLTNVTENNGTLTYTFAHGTISTTGFSGTGLQADPYCFNNGETVNFTYTVNSGYDLTVLFNGTRIIDTDQDITEGTISSWTNSALEVKFTAMIGIYNFFR